MTTATDIFHKLVNNKEIYTEDGLQSLLRYVIRRAITDVEFDNYFSTLSDYLSFDRLQTYGIPMALKHDRPPSSRKTYTISETLETCYKVFFFLSTVKAGLNVLEEFGKGNY